MMMRDALMCGHVDAWMRESCIYLEGYLGLSFVFGPMLGVGLLHAAAAEGVWRPSLCNGQDIYIFFFFVLPCVRFVFILRQL